MCSSDLDKLGLKFMITCGLLIYVFVYAGMAFAPNTSAVVALFSIYGIYAAATEGVSKAILSLLAPKNQTATALGFFSGWSSIGALCASSVAGLLWYKLQSPQLTFLVSSVITLAITVYISSRKKILPQQ